MKKYRFELLLFAFYLLLAVIITFPLILNFSSSIYSIPERTVDSFAAIYDFWWKKQAFLQDISPNFNALLGVSGTPIKRLFHMVIVEGVGKWLTILINEVFAYNLLILLGFSLSGLAMYFLAYHLTKSKPAAVLAGLIYAFSPLHRRYSFEWFGMAQWQWLPLYVLFLLKLDREKKAVWGILTGIMFALVAIENYYFGYFALFFTTAFVLFRIAQTWISERRFYFNGKTLRLYLLAAGIVFVLTLPITTAFIGESGRLASGLEGEIGGFVREEWPRFAFSARPWFYLFPDVYHPVFGDTVQKIYDWIATHPPYFITKPFYHREHSLFLGWTTLILSAVAVFRLPASGGSTRRVDQTSSKPDGFRRRSAAYVWLFLFLGIVMIIFSAPPYATINLRKIYFPSHYLYNLFPMFRSYARFGILVLLCTSVLAGFGFKFLLEKTKSRRGKVLLTLFAFCILHFEFLDIPPFHNVNVGTLPVYEWLAEQPGDFGIIVYPQDLSNFDLLAQRTHKKRFLNSKGRTTAEVREVLEHLNEVGTVEKLREWDVKYIVSRHPSSLGFEKNYVLIETYDGPRVYLFEVPNP